MTETRTATAARTPSATPCAQSGACQVLGTAALAEGHSAVGMRTIRVGRSVAPPVSGERGSREVLDSPIRAAGRWTWWLAAALLSPLVAGAIAKDARVDGRTEGLIPAPRGEKERSSAMRCARDGMAGPAGGAQPRVRILTMPGSAFLAWWKD